MARAYVAEALLALDALYRLGFVHRDVKPEQLVVSAATGHLLLCDFDLAGPEPEGDPDEEDGTAPVDEDARAEARGTLEYAAPEVLQGLPHLSRADRWQACVLLYELLHGRSPFAAGHAERVVYNITMARLELDRELGLSDECAQLLRCSLRRSVARGTSPPRVDPRTRLGAKGYELKAQ